MGSAEEEHLRNYLKLSRDELDSMNRGGNPNLNCNAQGLRAEQNGAKWNGHSPAIKNTAESSVGKERPEGHSKSLPQGGGGVSIVFKQFF
jgi:hypothetical protein